MTVEKLERVMWRMRHSHPGADLVSIAGLQDAIMREIGIDIRTYNRNKKALIKLGWIKPKGNKWLILTGDDLRG